MARLVLLDSGPLGLACYRPGLPAADRCRAWLVALQASGADIVIPTIADYEVRRELIRIGATARLRNLDALRAAFRTIGISDEAMIRAAEFWAIVRSRGKPTASPDALDADAILAGMAATVGRPGDSVTIATTNTAHLARFPGIVAQDWITIA